MPPKPKVSKQEIIEAAFVIARELGPAKINARAVGKHLGCSTQPIMSHFHTVANLKKAVYEYADQFHTQQMEQPHTGNPLKDLGLNYIEFAAKEKHLFQLLFQSNEFKGMNLDELITSSEITPLIHAISALTGLAETQAKTLFRMLFLFVHGYASLLANNQMVYSEKAVIKDLENAFHASLAVAKAKED